MLRAQILFFLPLAAASVLIARLGRVHRLSHELSSYIGVALVSWIGAAVVLFLVMSLLTPDDGLRDFVVLLGAYALPVTAVALACTTAAKAWSVEGRTVLSLAMAAAASYLAPFFLLLAACTLQASCL
jgi:hypothetical protein